MIALLFYTFLLNGADKAQTPSCHHDDKNFRCVKYLKNYDGDTLTFNIPNVHPLLGSKISVRVKNIDTAEIRGKLPCEKDSARVARKLVENKLKNSQNIQLLNVERDKYFRILADVIVDGDSIADLLIKNQLAVNYDGGKKKKPNWCAMGKSRVPADNQKEQ